MPDSNADELRDFFDRQQVDQQYESLKSMTRDLDREAARLLNDMVRGDTLTVGGIWDFFVWGDQIGSLTVLDLSPEMLKVYCPEGATPVVGDIYRHEFPPESFDSIVFPLMLHHTAQGSWRDCESRVERAIDLARSWLRRDGQLILLEACPNPAWMPVQRALLPLTKWFLALFKQPLVVMHTRGFYERKLTEQFGSSRSRLVHPEGFNFWKWYPVFMAVRWLRVPLVVYPKLYVMSAPAPAGACRETE